MYMNKNSELLYCTLCSSAQFNNYCVALDSHSPTLNRWKGPASPNFTSPHSDVPYLRLSLFLLSLLWCVYRKACLSVTFAHLQKFPNNLNMSFTKCVHLICKTSVPCPNTAYIFYQCKIHIVHHPASRRWLSLCISFMLNFNAKDDIVLFKIIRVQLEWLEKWLWCFCQHKNPVAAFGSINFQHYLLNGLTTVLF